MIKELTEKAKRYCAYTERCSYDVRQKLLSIGADESSISKIITRLQKEAYLDDERFARVFVNGKFQNNRWGKTRINAELIKRQLPKSLINKALEEIDEQSYRQCLLSVIKKKTKEMEGKLTHKRREKLMAYCLQKGFEPDLVLKTLDENYQP